LTPAAHSPWFKTERCRFLVENLNLERATGVEGARWEHFQIAHLNDDGRFRIEDKSRQIAWSWLVAAEAVADAVLDRSRETAGTVFVSINLEEAKEKIRYARRVFDSIELSGLPRLSTDNQLELEFDNGKRLISLPSKPPRGKARFNVDLDEFAHVQHDRQIYTAVLPVVSKGGRVRIGSSPMGASGVFWEIFSEGLRAYPGYTRKRTPWWEVQAFCRNVREARGLAPGMGTSERVELFGADSIKAIFANLPLEDFRQEYEAEFVDETTAWVSWDEIKANQDPALVCESAAMRGSDASAVFDAVERLARHVEDKSVERVFAGGLDVGRTRNTTELFLAGLSTSGQYPLRLMLTLEGVPFDTQKDVVARVMKALPVAKLLIDRNGLGMNLAEDMEREFPVKCEGVNFTQESKKLWATEHKMLLQQRKAPIPVDRELAYQIHSIKRKVTASKNMVFDTDRNEKHHADKYWAHALALSAAQHPPRPRRGAPPTTGFQSY
jgi:phage FluMu gp28-like protein